jgi:hypothetical protein
LEAEAVARQQRYQQRVAELAAAARARGQRPRAHIRPRRRDEAPNPKATINTTDPDSRFVRGNGRTLQLGTGATLDGHEWRSSTAWRQGGSL